MDLMRIGGMILGLFKRKRRSQKCSNRLFHGIKNSCNQKFYLETLKLKANEIELFLQFCEADPNQKQLQQTNTLSTMDFVRQNTEFKSSVLQNNLLFIPLNELTTIYSTTRYFHSTQLQTYKLDKVK
jgi:hypothetical protein